MMRHSQSFSDSLVLEDVEKGGVIVRSIRDDSSTDKGLKEGDEIVGATIYFDKLKKEEVLRILKLIESFDENMEVLTKHDLKACNLRDSYSSVQVSQTLNVKSDDLNGQVCPSRTGLHLEGPDMKDNIEGASKKKDLFNMHAKTPAGDIDTCLISSDVKPSAKILEDSMTCVNLSHLQMMDSDLPVFPNGLSSTTPKEPDVDDIPKGPKPNFLVPCIMSPNTGHHPNMENTERVDSNASCIQMINSSLHGSEIRLDAHIPNKKSDVTKQEGGVVPNATDIKAPTTSQTAEKLEMKCEVKQKVPTFEAPSNIKLSGIDTKCRKLDLKPPHADLKSPSQKCHFSTLHTFEISGSKVKDPMEINGDLKTPDKSLSAPKIKGEINASNMDMNLSKADFHTPKLDMKTPGLHIHSPSGNFSMPKMSLSGPNEEGPDIRIDAGLKKPDLNLTAPKIKGAIKTLDREWNSPSIDVQSPKLDLRAPAIDLKSPSLKFKCPKLPKFGISEPEVEGPEMDIDGHLKTPELNLSAPNMKGEINAPDMDMNLSKADFHTPELDMKTPGLHTDSPSGNFSMVTMTLSEPKVKGTNIEIDAGLKNPDLSLTAPKIKGRIKDPDVGWNLPSTGMKNPKLDLKAPNVDLNSPSLKFKFPKLPKFGISESEVKGPEMDIDGHLKTPELNLSAPKIKGEISDPELGLNLPRTDMKNPKLDLKAPNVDLKSPSLKFKFPKLPKFGISEPEVKGLEMDIDGHLKTPELNLSAPKIKGEISDPELGLNLPRTDMKNPKLDLKAPNIDLKSPSLKFKFPKLPKFGISEPEVKGPEMDIDGHLKTPKLNLSAPKIKGEISDPELGLNLSSTDMKNPKLDLKAPNVDLKSPSLKFKFPKLPKFGISEPEVKGPEMDIDGHLKTPELNLSAPKIKGEISDPEVGLNLPRTDMKNPKLDLKAPNVDLKSPSLKFKFPKLPKFGISEPEVKGPEMDIDGHLKTPELNLSAPKIKGEISDPELGLNLPRTDMKNPKLDLKAPNVDLKSPSLKFKFPKLPKFGISEPEVKGPEMDIDGHLKTPKLNLSAPKIKGEISDPELGLNLPSTDMKNPKLDLKAPNVDLKSPSLKFKFLKLPKFGISEPEVKGPEMDIDGHLKTPELNLSAPKIKGEISDPELGLNLPRTDMKNPKLDLKAPNVDLKSPSLKFKFPKLPKFGISEPEVKGPEMDIDGHLKTPELNLSAPKIKGEISDPELGLNLPRTDMKNPKLDLKAPNVDLKSPSLKFKFPKLPKFGISEPEVKGPEMDIDGDLRTPELNLSTPTITGEISDPELGLNLPRTDMKNPKLDLKAPNVDLKSPSLKFKFPKLPKFGISKPEVKGPEMDIEGHLKTPELNLSAPKIEGEINDPHLGWNLPSTDMKNPKLDLKAPNVDLNSPSLKFKFPKLPKFGISKPEVKGPEMDIDGHLKTPELNLSAPKIEGEINYSDLGCNLPRIDMKNPKLDLKAPNVDLNSPSLKFKFPKLPKFGISEPEVKGPEMDTDGHLKTPKLNLSAPKITGEINDPEVGLNLPRTDMKNPKLDLKAPNVDLKTASLKFKFPKLPKFGISKPEVKGPEINIDGDLKIPDFSLSAPKIKGEINAPDMDMNLPKADFDSPELDMKTPGLNTDSLSGNFSMPKMNLLGPKVKGTNIGIDAGLKKPDLRLSAPKIKREIKDPELGLSLPKGNFSSRELDAKTTDFDNNVLSGSLKYSSLKMAKFGFSGPKVKGSDVDIDTNLMTRDLRPPAVFGNPRIPGDKVPDLKHLEPEVQGQNLGQDLSFPIINSPDVIQNLPQTDLKGFKLNLKTPDLDLDALSQISTLRKPKYGLNIKRQQLDIDAVLNELSDSKMERPLNIPDEYICLPTRDVKGTKLDVRDLNVDAFIQSGVIKTSSVKNSKFGSSSINGPNLDATLKTTDMNLLTPKINTRIGKPGLHVNSSKADLQGQIDVETADIHLNNLSTGDSIKVNNKKYKSSEKDLCEVDTEVPELKTHTLNIHSLKAPDMDLEVPGGTLKRPLLRLQKM